ncbi:MAG: eIF2B alpha/beta/delta subunit family protein [Actinomycetota bacterium]
MNAWDNLRRVASDRKSGAAELAARTARSLLELETNKDIMKAARKLLRVHSAMGPMWRVFALALHDKRKLQEFADAIEVEDGQVARAAAGWALPKRARVITHSWSRTVYSTLQRAGSSRITSVSCPASLPGGEGRALAARLRRDGFSVRLVHDSEIARETASADIALCGADAVTERSVVNKVGTALLALSAQEHGVPCYALAGSSKIVPDSVPGQSSAYEATPLELFDAVIFERGPLREGQVRKAASKIEIPAALLRLRK